MLVEKYNNYLENERRLSKHTVKAYVDDIIVFKKFISKEFDEDDLSKIDYNLVRSWVASLIQKGLSTRTVNRKISSLKSFFMLLAREELIIDNPMAKIVKPKTSKRLPVFVEQENIKSLFDDLVFDDSFAGKRDKLVLKFFYSTGMRLSELINIKLKDVDFNLKQVKVLGKRNKERIVPLTNEVMVDINDYVLIQKNITVTCDNLFITNKGSKLYEKFVYRLVNSYLGQVSTVSKKSPHVLRHTFATHMLNNGAELNVIKELLGHANLSATEIYTHNTFEKLKNIYKQAHPRA